MPLFSVVIPAYNRREKLQSAIESVLSQDFRDYELTVVDDGSTDGTEAMASTYGSRLRYIYQQNSGVSSARNAGIKASSSPYIALLDSDDTWHKRKLSMHREFIDSHPGINIHQTGDLWVRNGVKVNPGIRHIKKEGFIFSESLKLCMISPSSVLFSRQITEKYGLFDEALPACEDYDLWLRVTPFEYVGLIPEKLITRYSGHADQLSSIHPLMDRFRLYSILKLIENSRDSLKKEYMEEALKAADEKARILLAGSLKRGNTFNAGIIEDIISSLAHGRCTRREFQSLLQLQQRF